MKIYPAKKREIKQIKKWYYQNFPKEERKSFRMITEKIANNQMELVSITEEELVGFAIVILHKNGALLDYFAISPFAQGKGVGSEALLELQKRYASYRTFLLEIEWPDESAYNAKQRMKRKKFYLRNGMRTSGLHVNLFGVEMEVYYKGTPLSFEEYLEIYRDTIGFIADQKIELL